MLLNVSIAIAIILSLSLIIESRITAGFIRGLLGLPEKFNVYDRQNRFWWVLALFRWPFLFGLIGYIAPTLWWDFLVTLAGGLIFEAIQYLKRKKAEKEKLKKPLLLQPPPEVNCLYKAEH